MASTKMFRNFISHNQTHEKPPSKPIIFSRWVPIKKTIAKFYGDVTLVVRQEPAYMNHLLQR